MNKISVIAVALVAALGMLANKPAQAAGLERLYILNCGEGTAGDISRWSPGVNVGKSMPFVDNCYLLKHGAGLDAVGHRPDRCDRRHARWAEAGRSGGDPLVSARRRWRASSKRSASSRPTSSSWRCRTPIPTTSATSRCSRRRCCSCRRPNTTGRAPKARRASSRSIRSPSSKATRTCSATAASRSCRRRATRRATSRCW